ncbi:MAG TPA: pitrilysin family protein [Gemmatimonadales bacterium]|nr:pitrilysin family protein [Gemmatimonadales bacterium]
MNIQRIKRGVWLGIGITLCLAAPAVGQQVDRSKPPALGPVQPLSLPPITRHTLSNGLPVLVMEKHQVPLVQVNLLVKSGSAMDPADKPGLASMTADMLEEGAGTRGALALADAIDFLGAEIDVTAEQHRIGVALHTPVARIDSALALMADVALRPTFPADELERLRRERLTDLAQEHDEPRAVARVLFMHSVFGDAHPYGRMTSGTEASLRAFTPDDFRRFHQAYFRPDNAALVVVGDVTADQILPKLEAAFGKWSAGGSASPPPRWSEASQVTGRQVFLADKPGAAQTEVIIGRVGVPRSTPDYYALTVLNTALGGSFTSRLNQNLREEKQYTYGAFSQFQYEKLAGPFFASAAVQTAVTDKALVEFMKELTRIRSGLTDDELVRAKNYVALRFPGRFQSIGTIARQLGDLVIYDLPLDYYNNYVQRIQAVTAADVKRVANQYIDPNKMVIVLVGDKAKIEAGVRALKLGTIRTLTIDEVLGPAPVVTTSMR